MHEPRIKKIHRKLAKIMQDDGDHCTMCRTEFPARSITFGGVTKSGSVEYVGDCCRRKLKEIYCGGLVV